MKQFLQIIRVVLGLVIFAFMLEVCARVDDAVSYGASLWAPYNSDILFSQDQIGKRGQPGARYQKWQMNSLGYRGPELRPAAVRIVCIGASETFGLYEPAGDEFPRQLERQLNARVGKDAIQVVNAAVVGETLAAAARRVPEIVNRANPSIAVIYPSAAAYIWLPWVREEPLPSTSSGAVPAQSRVRFELRVAERVRTLLKQALPGNIQTRLRQWETKKEIEKYHYPILERVPEENVLRFRKHLEKLVANLRARGVEPVLVTHATYFGQQLLVADRNMMIAWRKFYPMLSEDGFLDMENRMNAAIREVAGQQHLVLVDAANQIPPGSNYFADFSHFTRAGAEIMASRLADGLQPLIEARMRETSLKGSLPPVARQGQD